MFSSSIGHNLPVVNALVELNISEEVPENVLVLFDIKLPFVW